MHDNSGDHLFTENKTLNRSLCDAAFMGLIIVIYYSVVHLTITYDIML